MTNVCIFLRYNLCDDTSIYNYNLQSNIQCIFIYRCLIYNNKVLFNYALNYMFAYSISTMIIDSNCDSQYSLSTLLYYNKYDINLIEDHEKSIIFMRSLRGTWITACAFI